MQPDNRLFPAPREFVRQHLIWLFGLFPVALAGVKLFTASRGGPEVFGFLLRDLNVVQLILATIVSFAPLAVFWAYVVWFDWVRRTPQATRNQVMPEWLDQPIWNATGLVIFIMPVFQLLMSLGILIFLFWHRQRERAMGNLRWGPNHGKRLAPIFWSARGFLLSIVLQGLVGASVGWFPYEAVKD